MAAGKESFLQARVMAVTRVLRNNDGMVVGGVRYVWYH